MHDDPVLLSADDAQTVENVLADTDTPATTRRWLLERAAVGAAAASAVGAFGPASSALARGRGDSVKTVGTTAVTAEALAVTFLTEVIRRGGLSTQVDQVLRAANAEEERHFRVLRKSGFKPLTDRFWIPDAFFGGGDEKKVAAVIEIAETLFVNAYLIGITTFARAGKTDFARYAGEILGTEAEHRALARFVQGKLPNNVAFEGYRYSRMSHIVKALEAAGVGFGTKGSAAGAFHTFRGAGNAVVPITNKNPH